MYKNRRGEEIPEEKGCQQKFESWKLHELILTVTAFWTQQKTLQRGKAERDQFILAAEQQKDYAGTGATKKP